MLIKKTFNEIINHSKSAFSSLNKETCEEFIQTIINSKNIFVLGGGRSGLVAKAFAMRLMHLGLKVNVLGENTPHRKASVKNVLIAISGSGNTEVVVQIANYYKKSGVTIISITSDTESKLAKLSDTSITINMYDNTKNKDENYAAMPLGTSFELATLLTLESMIPDFMNILNVTEEDMEKRHVQFEFIDIYL